MKFDKIHETLYSMLAKAGPSTSESLASRAPKFTVTEVDEALQELVVGSFIEHDGKAYAALDPHDVVARNNIAMTQDLIEMSSTDLKNREVYASMVESFKQAMSLEPTSSSFKILHSIEETQDLLVRIGSTLTQQSFIMNTTPGFGIDKLTAQNPDVIRTLKGPLTFKRIVTEQALSEVDVKRVKEIFKGHSYDIKVVDTIQIQMQVLGGRHTLLAAPEFPGKGAAFYFEDKAVANMATEIFAAKWKTAEPVNLTMTEADAKSDEERNQIFKLLLEHGLSDHEVRKQMNLTPKMFRTRIARYSKAIGAQNRSQLDAYAFTHGWHEN